jgi:hypothetical protein
MHKLTLADQFIRDRAAALGRDEAKSANIPLQLAPRNRPTQASRS